MRMIRKRLKKDKNKTKNNDDGGDRIDGTMSLREERLCEQVPVPSWLGTGIVHLVTILIYKSSLFKRIVTPCCLYLLQVFSLVLCFDSVNVFFLSEIFIYVVNIISSCVSLLCIFSPLLRFS